jgi:uncharacterized protein (TIGR00106 family)
MSTRESGRTNTPSSQTHPAQTRSEPTTPSQNDAAALSQMGVASWREDLGMIAAFSITPLGIGASVSEPVAEAVRLVRDSGLSNETNAMFTNVEGEWDDVMALIKACVMTVAEAAPRVSVVIKIDHRPGVSDALRGKVDAVEERLARPRASRP